VQPENGTMTWTEGRLPDAADWTMARPGPRNLPWLVLVVGTPLPVLLRSAAAPRSSLRCCGCRC